MLISKTTHWESVDRKSAIRSPDFTSGEFQFQPTAPRPKSPEIPDFTSGEFQLQPTRAHPNLPKIPQTSRLGSFNFYLRRAASLLAKGAILLNDTRDRPQWRIDLENKMREVASDPESSFPERLEAVLQQVQPDVKDTAYLMRPGPCDRIMALTLFFQVTGFIRVLTTQMLARFPDDDIAEMALCLGLEPPRIAGQETHIKGGPRNE
jgi:hypothetical protein